MGWGDGLISCARHANENRVSIDALCAANVADVFFVYYYRWYIVKTKWMLVRNRN